MLREFEKRLVGLWRLQGGATRTQLRTLLWIKGHLESVGEDYCYRSWKLYQDFVRQARGVGVTAIQHSTYQEFALYWWLLKQEDLLIPTRKEPGLGGLPRQYYALNPKAPEYKWEMNPREELHYTSKALRRLYRRRRR